MSAPAIAPDESTIGALERALDQSSPEEKKRAGLPQDERALADLRADARALGLLGTIAVLASSGAPEPEVAKEAPERILRDLEEGLGPDAPKAVAARVAAYAEKKGPRGPDLARRLIGRSLHDLYDLEPHGLTSDCVLRALNVIARSRADMDARELVRALLRLSPTSGRIVLGHLEGQLLMVHRLATEEVMPGELDRPVLEFAPRIFAQRLPSIAKQLLSQEARFRLAVVLWGRFRGIVLGRERLVHALDGVVPEKPISLLRALSAPDVVERRRVMALAEAQQGEARAIEDATEEAF